MERTTIESLITPRTDSIQNMLVYGILESGDGQFCKDWASLLANDVIPGGLKSISGRRPITAEEKLKIENSPAAMTMLDRVLVLPQGTPPGADAEKFFRGRRELGSIAARMVSGAVEKADHIRELNSLYYDRVASQ